MLFVQRKGRLCMQAVEAMNPQFAPKVTEGATDMAASKKLNFRSITQWLNSPSSSIELFHQDSQGRNEVESFIAEQYQRVYGANIQEFMPQLMTFKCKNKLSTAVGIKSALLKPLFIEQYLDQPVEKVIESQTQAVVERKDIVEVGNLAASWKGTSQLIMVLMPVILERAGYKWSILTATGQVERLLRKICLTPITLCEADESRVSNDDEVWGNYYQQSTPHVMVGCLVGIEERLSKHRLLRHILKIFSTEIDDIVNQIKFTR